jgi:hypothetical protein
LHHGPDCIPLGQHVYAASYHPYIADIKVGQQGRAIAERMFLQELRALQAEIFAEIKANKRARANRRDIRSDRLEDSDEEVNRDTPPLSEDSDSDDEGDEDDVDYLGARIFRHVPPRPFHAKQIVPLCMHVDGPGMTQSKPAPEGSCPTKLSLSPLMRCPDLQPG